MNSKYGYIPLVVITVFFIIGTVAGFWYFTQGDTASITSQDDYFADEGNTATFTDSLDRFSLQYPADWKVYSEEMVFTSWDSNSAQPEKIPAGEGVIIIQTFTDSSSPTVQRLMKRPHERDNDGMLPLYPSEESYPPAVYNSILYFYDDYDKEVAESMGINPEDVGFDKEAATIGISLTDGSTLYHVTGIQNAEIADGTPLDLMRGMLETWDFMIPTPYDDE